MANISQTQTQLLEKLQAQVPDLEVRWSEERGVADLLEGRLMFWDKIGEPERILPAVMAEYGVLLGPPEIAKGHRVTGVSQDKKRGGYRARACQVVDSLPVYGATLLVFADRERGVYRVQSSFWREVKVTAEKKLDEKDLKDQLFDRLRKDTDAARFEEAWRKQKPDAWSVEHFPLAGYPTLYLYPVKDGFHPAYNTLAYQPMEWQGVDGKLRREIGQVEIILDAATGEVIWLESTREGMAYTDQTGDGLSTLQDSNSNYFTRALHVVRKDSGNFFMLNRLQTPEIRTYDANGTLTLNKLKSDTDLSEDTDSHWNTTTTSCTTNTRRDAQQSEVDGHFNAAEAWVFYHNLGWDGFDDGAYGTHCPVRVVAHIGMDANAYFDKFVEPVPNTTTNKYYGYIAFYDGQCDGTTLKFDFMAGDPVIFGHEYQHAVTFFGASKSNGEPGYLYWNMWSGAIREGYSDALACLRRGLWINAAFYPDGAIHGPASGSGAYQLTLSGGSTITVYPRPFRRIEYPRSSNTYDESSYCDHYDDRDSSKDKYFHSTLLSHLAYLVGQGGVHQRAARGNAEFIPVTGVGLQRTAEIFLYALTQYFGTLSTNLSGETLIEAARLLLDAAKAVSGNDRTCEYVMMRRALYALGLYPYDISYNKQTYGGEACMLPWTYSWRFSQPYLGLPALWWQSPDLFINNNGSVEYDAVVGQENKVFARVRNIGDQDLKNLKVKFYFCPIGTNLPASIAGWHPCKNQAGADCVLDITTLAAGSMNITNVNNPPANQARNWYLDPAYVTSQVDHFCLRAVIECEANNNNNDCPNEVQSNIQYAQPSEGAVLDFGFLVANWENKPSLLDLRITQSLPRGYRLEYIGDQPLKKIVLQPREPQVVKFKLHPPQIKPVSLAPPYDGKVTGELKGKVSGRFVGELSGVRPEPQLSTTLKKNIGLSGMIAGTFENDEKASLNGEFQGELDRKTGTIRGVVKGNVALADGHYLIDLNFKLEGRLEPLRAIHFTQFVNGGVVGGVTIVVKEA
jgi:Zn-dependent metalloprotease